MTRRDKLSAGLYLVTLVAAVCFFVAMYCGCGGKGEKPPDVPRLMSCAEKVVAIITETPDCTQIGRKVDELLAAQAECFEALSGEKAIQWSCGDGGAAH